jgi:hypothetical protein
MPADADRRGPAHGVEVVVDQRFQEDVVAPLLVDQGRRLDARGDHVDHRGQIGIFDLHLRRDVFGFRARSPDAHRDRFAHVPHLAAGERPQLGGLEPLQAGDRAYRLHAREVAHEPHAVLETRRLLRGDDPARAPPARARTPLPACPDGGCPRRTGRGR